jgi:dethiobiotin synthetase
MIGLFFTGTDTGVGKTHVVAAVARTLRAAGKAVRVSKPVATGATWTGRRWLSEDTERLASACGCSGESELDAITPWALPEPAAPPVAARAAGIKLRLGDLAEAVRRQARPEALLLVEGVGGLLCPLTEWHTVADLMAELALPAVVVIRRSLGTLNHTLLTLGVALQRGLSIAGVVVSETTPPQGLAEQTNVEELRRRITVPLLGVLPHGAGEQALAGIDWWRLANIALCGD